MKNIELLLFCFESIDNSEIEYKIKILYNLSYAYHRLDFHHLALEYANKGIDICVKNNNLHCLALLFTRRGIAKYFIKKGTYKEDLVMAKKLHEIAEESILRDQLIKFCKELYDINI